MIQIEVIYLQRYYSNVYWHFTGSPDVDWSKIKMPKQIKGKAKDTERSVDILGQIISSGKLLAGKPELIYGQVKTKGFCCVCDIPFKDLVQHSQYYGKVAIGFSADSIHSLFNPVLYIPRDFTIPLDLKVDLNREIDLEKEYDLEEPVFDLIGDLLGFEDDPDYNERLSLALGHFKNLMKVTGFSQNDEETFYREREWRKIGDYIFSVDEVEAVIVPEQFTGQIKKHLINNNYGNTTVIPYEFVEKV